MNPRKQTRLSEARSGGKSGRNRRSIYEATRDVERLKRRLLTQVIKESSTRVRSDLLRAADEAASVAWMTPYPLLFLPELLKEKVQAAQRRAVKQQNVLARSESIISLAV